MVELTQQCRLARLPLGVAVHEHLDRDGRPTAPRDGAPMYLEISGVAHTFGYAAPVDLNASFASALFTLPTNQPVQPGPDTIADAADERPSDAVYRSGHLWFVAAGDSFDGANHWTAARYTEVLTTANYYTADELK